MDSVIPWQLFDGSQKSDYRVAKKRIRINNEVSIRFISNPIPKGYEFMPWTEQIDEFHYPSLDTLRKDFKESGMYSDEKIEELISMYERLPQYRTGSRSSSPSKKRSKIS